MRLLNQPYSNASTRQNKEYFETAIYQIGLGLASNLEQSNHLDTKIEHALTFLPSYLHRLLLIASVELTNVYAYQCHSQYR